MKIRTKVLIGLLALGCISCTVAACATDKNPYPGLEGNGYGISVRYDSNGGQFLNANEVDIVHNFTLENRTAEADGSYKIQLIEPGSDKLDANTIYKTNIFRTGYFLAGWYKTRTLRIDANGKPLDEDGNVCDRTNEYGVLVSANGKAQGYEYSGKWDFSTDRLTVNADGTQSIDTLYAAWVPNFKYSFMVYGTLTDSAGKPITDENGVETQGWYSGGEYVFDPPTSDDTVKIGLPSWKDGDEDDDGVLNMKNFKVSVENKTFLKAYKVGNADGTCTDEFTADIEHFGEIDYEKAVSVNANRVVYTTWRDGNWFHIRTANQLINNAYANGCYEIHKDLDFTDKTWPMAFAGEFSGRFVSGDGTVHTVSNLKARQNPGDYNVKRGGIFGEITAEAVIEKLDFVDAEYTCSGSRMQDAYFGLFAGYLDEDATLTDVTISGQLNISPTTLFYNNKVSVGVFSGNGVTLGVNTSNITCGLTTEIEPPYKYTLTNDGGKITVTYEFIGF